MCCHVGVVLKVYFVSQRSLKSVEEAPGDGLFKKVYLLVCAKRLRRSPERTLQNDLKALALVFLKRW